MDNKPRIEYQDGIFRYFDKNGVELKDGDTVVYDDGREEKLYSTDQGRLGTDATNRGWIASGKAVPCEYGIYPLERSEMHQLRRKEN